MKRKGQKTCMKRNFWTDSIEQLLDTNNYHNSAWQVDQTLWLKLKNACEWNIKFKLKIFFPTSESCYSINFLTKLKKQGSIEKFDSLAWNAAIALNRLQTLFSRWSWLFSFACRLGTIHWSRHQFHSTELKYLNISRSNRLQNNMHEPVSVLSYAGF